MISQIEELLGQPVELLESLSVADLTARLQHYFHITRPEEAKKNPTQHRSFSSGANAIREAKLARAKELAKAAGIDLGL